MNTTNPNINDDAKKVLNDLFGLTNEDCDNLDPECSFVSPSFLREIIDRENKKLNEAENEFEKRFANASDEELIKAFNNDLGKPGVVAARFRFLAALRKEFDRRGYECPTGRIIKLVKKNETSKN